MSPWDSAELLTLAQAAEALGIKHPHPGRWLRRYIQRRETATGCEILIHLGQSRGRGARYYVSMKALRDACPEIVQPNRRIEDSLRNDISGLSERVARLEDLAAEMSSSLAEIHDSVRILTEAIRQLNVSIVSKEPKSVPGAFSCNLSR